MQIRITHTPIFSDLVAYAKTMIQSFVNVEITTQLTDAQAPDISVSIGDYTTDFTINQGTKSIYFITNIIQFILKQLRT